ncbi:hypothetical protein E2C01_070928 [Portunus trituberculatus]|uniref:Uncharacterized protein n=1 Tax=Portunus trituberculatus TaxID=210409 RepID=A0A5B7HYN5_PORTR|nr:hypothetical protein [Portunus trituberculatus]
MVIVAYVNMGCAIDLKIIKETLRRPVAPAIGLASQYLFMPLFQDFRSDIAVNNLCGDNYGGN